MGAYYDPATKTLVIPGDHIVTIASALSGESCELFFDQFISGAEQALADGDKFFAEQCLERAGSYAYNDELKAELAELKRDSRRSEQARVFEKFSAIVEFVPAQKVWNTALMQVNRTRPFDEFEFACLTMRVCLELLPERVDDLVGCFVNCMPTREAELHQFTQTMQ